MRTLVLTLSGVLLVACEHAKSPTSDAPSGYGLMGFVPGRCPSEPCKTCDIASVARAAAGPGATDCGWSRKDKERERLVRCALEQAAGTGRFVAIESLQGIDSFIIEAFARGADGELLRFWYDSDGSGANCPCSAFIRRHRCTSVLTTEREEPDALRCDTDPTPGDLVCSEKSPSR